MSKISGDVLEENNYLKKTLIYPYLTYGLMSWVTAHQTKLHKFNISQTECIRCISFAKKKRERESSHIILYTIRNLKVRESF